MKLGRLWLLSLCWTDSGCRWANTEHNCSRPCFIIDIDNDWLEKWWNKRLEVVGKWWNEIIGASIWAVIWKWLGKWWEVFGTVIGKVMDIGEHSDGKLFRKVMGSYPSYEKHKHIWIYYYVFTTCVHALVCPARPQRTEPDYYCPGILDDSPLYLHVAEKCGPHSPISKIRGLTSERLETRSEGQASENQDPIDWERHAHICTDQNARLLKIVEPHYSASHITCFLLYKSGMAIQHRGQASIMCWRAHCL